MRIKTELTSRYWKIGHPKPLLLWTFSKNGIKHWMYKGILVFAEYRPRTEILERPNCVTDIPGLHGNSCTEVFEKIDALLDGVLHYSSKVRLKCNYGEMMRMPCGMRLFLEMDTETHPSATNDITAVTCKECKRITIPKYGKYLQEKRIR